MTWIEWAFELTQCFGLIAIGMLVSLIMMLTSSTSRLVQGMDLRDKMRIAFQTEFYKNATKEKE